MAPSPNATLIAELQRPEAYPHEVATIQLRETHISWVLLTGEFSYKIKKPVDLGFVDFSTLERRRHFCEEEVRLNRRTAADLYLDVVPIVSTDNGWRVSGAGAPVEYAVRMRQFDEEQLAARLLADGRLGTAQIDQLAARVASMHESAERVGTRDWGAPARVRAQVTGNFTALRPLIDEPSRLHELQEIEDWSLQRCDTLAPVFERRRADGLVRQCHGDLHLGNVVQWQGVMTPFDCIEFNPAFRWIDVINEVAFLIMDLGDHRRPDLGWRFLNEYLEFTGDYAGLSVLPFYLVYRALVRAKVDVLRLQQAGLATGERRRLTTEWQGYLDLARGYTRNREPSLTITHGVSGSGKTTGTQPVIEQDGAIRIRSDIERKRQFGLAASDNAQHAIDAGIYAPGVTEQTYQRLAELARVVVGAGFPVIVDATFLLEAQRQRFHQIARELEVPFRILTFHSDEQTLRNRIRRRLNESHDASDATIEVLEHQLLAYEPLTPDEQRFIDVAPPELQPERDPDC